MKYKQLTREQRYAIYLGYKEKKTKTAIAQQIGVSVSTVCREIKRHLNRHGKYLWKEAHELAIVKRERSTANRKKPKHVIDLTLRLLKEKEWSPEQISGRLAREGIYISHETIYKIIRNDDTGELRKHCRHKMRYRHHIHKPKSTKATNIPNRISIHDRPAEADGSRRGDWEMDLILGKDNKSAVLTMTHRIDNFIVMTKIPNKKPEVVAKAVWKLMLPFKGDDLKTITTDNGTEFRDHQTITKMLGAIVYFTDAYSSWQKGAIENANKLIRQYFPKGTDFNLVSDRELIEVQKKINNRPRAKLNFLSPKEVFFKLGFTE